MGESQKVSTLESRLSKECIEKLEEMVKDVQFGSVSIIIQDGKVIQLEKNEKLRLK